MIRSELKRLLEAKMAPSQPLEWDNDGILVADSLETEVSRVLLVLDVTEEAVEEAVKKKCDVILSHHPMIFHPVSAVTPETGCGRKIAKLLKNNIAVFSYHTRLDAARGGVNDTLAELLGLSNVRLLGEGEAAMGRIGTLSVPATPESFSTFAKAVLKAPSVRLTDKGGKVSKVAVMGGAGKDFVEEAEKQGADLYLTGELGYHPLTEGYENKISLLECGHYETEFPVLATLASWLRKWDKNLQITIFPTNRIKTY